MPELPEVQTVVNTLRSRLVGVLIRQTRVNRADVIHPAGTDFSELLRGRTVKEVARRAKRIIFELDDGRRFYIHLGMSGRLTIDTPGSPILPHTHVILQTDSGEVRFTDPRRFGGIWWLDRQDGDVGKLGPEPLSMSPAQLKTGLARTKRAIKTALLDQSLVAGLGNIYVDEALFEARINPRIPARSLKEPQVIALSGAIKRVLNRALRHRGSTLRDYRDADGNAGEFQNLHRVYGRQGKPCARCRTPIKRIVLGARSTHFCPNCQRRRPAG